MTAMEMTKWFDTNYHYLVPELGPDTRFSLSSSKPFDEHAEAMEELGIDTVPVLIGPVSFLLLSKSADGAPERLRPPRPDRAAARGLRRGDRAARRAGRDLGAARRALLRRGPLASGSSTPCGSPTRSSARSTSGRGSCVKTYFDHVGDAYGVLRDLPIEGIGLDFTGVVHGDVLSEDVHVHGGRHNVEFAGRGRASRTSGCSPASSTGATSGSTTSSIQPRRCSTASRDRTRAAGGLDFAARCCTRRRPGRRAGRRGRRPRRRAALLDGIRRPEGGRGRDARQGPRRGPRRDRRRARRQRPRARGLAPRLPPDPQPGGPRPRGGPDRRRRPPRAPSFRQRKEAQRARLELAAVPDDDDRLLPADGRDPPGAQRAAGGRDRARRRTRSGCAPRSSG